ncbi:imidazole glycerol phosphate synthase subunit HisH [Paenibacillus antri]|uniref:Imidazole glycerol phosphate synthase subunit HisH n=1 Tax=Paenibacillus antri TaxID=2582848 RepID=A0A5R9G5E2_9BACL|nr:imidazole glycerol phosphate synthase subunit HisH [Paenibacillus antri]TLS49350.1 imidazole glycerol phosphate synthase subunit HisH [Paenibacillus antri]
MSYIAIIDYGMGNLHSVGKAVERLGAAAVVTADPAAILAAEGVILPGVGAYGDAMELIRESGLDATIGRVAESGQPLLGICLGMQLLFTESEEHGTHMGLNLLPGRVERFKGPFKVPHMGWNRLTKLQDSPILDGIDGGHAYFVHSYRVIPDVRSDLLATADYYGEVSAIVGRGNVYGMQFHPEKSSDLGMRLLGNFLKLSAAKPAKG